MKGGTALQQITADPNTLRYAANRFRAASQEMQRKSANVTQTASTVRQGSDGWTGEGSQAYLLRCEALSGDIRKASLAFESAANTLLRFAMRMEQVLELRHRADRLDQQAFQYGDDTQDSILTRQHLRHQAAQLRHQADNEASVADSQASSEFHHIAAMVPPALNPGTTELPKHWSDYYARHPELLEPEKGAADRILTRKDLLAMLIDYHKQQESPWLPDETRQEAAETYCKTAYSALTEEELKSEIARILESEAESAHWQDQIQAGVYGRELINQPGYMAYAMREFVKNEGMGKMHGVLAKSGQSRDHVDAIGKKEHRLQEQSTIVNSTTSATNTQAPPSRPNWRQSELDVGKNYPDYEAQKSFKDGLEVPYGTKGSSRPDYYKTGHSLEVKNYNVQTHSGRNRLVENVAYQVNKRETDLPPNTSQTVIIDVRGQSVSNQDLREIRNAIIERTNPSIFIQFMR